jgi:beta-glucanase (GH16 family)
MEIRELKRITLLILTVLFLACNSIKTKDKTETKDTTKTKKVKIEKQTNWELVWSDEFNNETLNENNWNFQEVEAGRFNEEWQRYTKSDKNAYIENDCLVIEAIHKSEEHGENQYTSARLNTAGKQSWKYGKFSARIKLPEGEGIWPAFWMLGANINENGGDTPWPQCGEIDILELYGSKDNTTIEVNAHYADSTGSHAFMGAKSYTLEQGKFSDDFHIFELEWTEIQLIWFVDGNKVTSMPIDKPYLTEFHKEFFILLNIAVGGTYAGRPDDSTKFPQTMIIDWIRVYQNNDLNN